MRGRLMPTRSPTWAWVRWRRFNDSLSSRPSDPAIAFASRLPMVSTVDRLRRSMLLAASHVALIRR
jgi:hypothetical protein